MSRLLVLDTGASRADRIGQFCWPGEVVRRSFEDFETAELGRAEVVTVLAASGTLGRSNKLPSVSLWLFWILVHGEFRGPVLLNGGPPPAAGEGPEAHWWKEGRVRSLPASESSLNELTCGARPRFEEPARLEVRAWTRQTVFDALALAAWCCHAWRNMACEAADLSRPRPSRSPLPAWGPSVIARWREPHLALLQDRTELLARLCSSSRPEPEMGSAIEGYVAASRQALATLEELARRPDSPSSDALARFSQRADLAVAAFKACLRIADDF